MGRSYRLVLGSQWVGGSVVAAAEELSVGISCGFEDSSGCRLHTGVTGRGVRWIFLWCVGRQTILSFGDSTDPGWSIPRSGFIYCLVLLEPF